MEVVVPGTGSLAHGVLMADTAAAHLRTLAEQLAGGGRDVLEWYQRYREPLRAYLKRMRSPHPASSLENLLEEAFMHLCFARASGPLPDPEQFLFTTARNLLKDVKASKRA